MNHIGPKVATMIYTVYITNDTSNLGHVNFKTISFGITAQLTARLNFSVIRYIKNSDILSRFPADM